MCGSSDVLIEDVVACRLSSFILRYVVTVVVYIRCMFSLMCVSRTFCVFDVCIAYVDVECRSFRVDDVFFLKEWSGFCELL